MRSPEIALSVSWILLMLAVVGVLGRCACTAGAELPPLPPPSRELERLALELAVVAAHEGALENVAEADLVWQVVESRARTTEARREFLYAHSARALGRRACNGRNCEWSVQLLERPAATPEGFSRGWWQQERAEAWELVRDRARALVYGARAERPCAGQPYSWGYAGDLESAYNDRGLVPMGCEGVMNDGFTFAPKRAARVAISARDAAGQR